MVPAFFGPRSSGPQSLAFSRTTCATTLRAPGASRRGGAMAEERSFEEALSMMSAHRISQAIRSWSYLGAMPVIAALAVAACGGKVVVDGPGSGGGGGGTTQSSAAVMPSTGSSTQNVCDAGIAHLKTCDPSIGEIPQLPTCDGMLLCQFTCILVASCAAIQGTDIAGTQQLANCLMVCT